MTSRRWAFRLLGVGPLVLASCYTVHVDPIDGPIAEIRLKNSVDEGLFDGRLIVSTFVGARECTDRRQVGSGAVPKGDTRVFRVRAEPGTPFMVIDARARCPATVFDVPTLGPNQVVTFEVTEKLQGDKLLCAVRATGSGGAAVPLRPLVYKRPWDNQGPYCAPH